MLKDIIESMIIGYLNESEEDDLLENIFQEVSEETWEAIEEAILLELSPETLKSYYKKSEKQSNRLTKNIASARDREYRAELSGQPKKAEKIFFKNKEDRSKRTKRYTGQNLAASKYQDKTGKWVGN